MKIYKIDLGYYDSDAFISQTISADSDIEALDKVLKNYPDNDFNKITIWKIRPGITEDE